MERWRLPKQRRIPTIRRLDGRWLRERLYAPGALRFIQLSQQGEIVGPRADRQ